MVEWLAVFIAGVSLLVALAAQNELRAIRKRGEAPFLVPAEVHGHYLEFCSKGDRIGFEKVIRPGVDLTVFEGEEIILPVDNIAKNLHTWRVRIDGEEGAFLFQALADGKRPVYAIKYPFKSVLRGQWQILEIAFLVEGGADGIHRYLIQHGEWGLLRIYPPFPPARWEQNKRRHNRAP